MIINGIKFACNTCVKGHRSSNCNHIERPLFEIRKKGRPVTQCAFCRDLRKTKQIHIKCTCTDKSKNIENTATICNQCPPNTSKNNNTTAMDEHGISYSGLMHSSIMNNGQLTQKEGSVQCTCHEQANKLMLFPQQHQQQENAPLIVKPRGTVIEDPIPSSSTSLRLLGQTKSPRRKSSSSSNNSKRRSIQTNDFNHVQLPNNSEMITNQQKRDDTSMMVDMQSFLFNQHQPELNTDCTGTAAMVVDTNSNIDPYPSSATTYSDASSTSFNTSPINPLDNHFNVNMKKEDMEFMISTDPTELTLLLNNVLNDDVNNHGRRQAERGNVDMARSTTNHSYSSSSSANNYNVQPHCGSFNPHTGCSSMIDAQGESVVITITPLSTMFTAADEPIVDRGNINSKPVTRIVTCYCGQSCICPGCFVHPNNYLQFNHHMQQKYQQNNYIQSSSTSSYSSDDEDHHMNRTALF